VSLRTRLAGRAKHGQTLTIRRSNPKSEHYGKHLSSEEVIDLFAPAADSVDVVTDWLKSAGFAADRVSQSVNKQWMQFDATAAEVEDLLFTKFYVYEHRPTSTQNVACDEYHIPAHIREHIDYITPGIRLRVDPGKAKKAKREYQAEQLRKRGVSAMNTGAVPISEARLPGLPQLNSSVCNKYVTNQCVRSKFRSRRAVCLSLI
jgi:tripeptidyl-peptidase-1